MAGPGVAARPGTVPALAVLATSLVAPTGSRWRWRWRAAPAGATWSRRSPPPGFEAHLAEPADTQAARGRKRHAKTDRSDARLLRELLQSGDLPESWIPPTAVLEWRERVRLYKSLVDQRRVWIAADPRRVVPARRRRARGGDPLGDDAGPAASDEVDLTPAGRQRVRVGYSMLEATDVEAQSLKRDLQRFGHRQPACRALVEANYGIGGLIAVAVWSELGDCRRFSRSEQVVRHTGLDVTVDASDRHRAHGYLTRQGPPTLRWALFEAAMNASHRRSPDHAYYTHGEGPSRRQARRDLRRPPVRPTLLPHPAQPRSRRRLRDAGLTTAGYDGRDRPRQHHGSPPRSAPATGVPASLRAGRPSNTDATALPAHGGHPITIVVADDTTFVEHLGNAGRPHAAVNRPIASLHRPSGWSRSFVLASLRALHLDQRLRPGALRAKRALTTGPHTGNARRELPARPAPTPPPRGSRKQATAKGGVRSDHAP